MKNFLNTAFALILCLSPQLASADWAENLTTNPSLETPIPVVPTSVRTNREYFFWIQPLSTLSSSWIFLSNSVNVDVCFIPNVNTLSATSSWQLNVLSVPHSYGMGPLRPNGADSLSAPLLGKVLTGAADADCIYDIKGPMYIAIDILVTGTTPGLISVAHRGY